MDMRSLRPGGAVSAGPPQISEKITGPRVGLVQSGWMDHPDCDADMVSLLSVLSTFANREGDCWPSQRLLALKLKRSEAWISRVAQRAVAAGLLVRVRRPGSRGYLFSLPGHGVAMAALAGPGPTCELAGEQDAHLAPRQAEQVELESGISLSARDRGPGVGTAAIDDREGVARRHRSARAVPPASWVPSAEDVAYAMARRPDLDPLLFGELFVLSCRANGYAYADPSAAYRKWLIDFRGDLHDRFKTLRRDRASAPAANRRPRANPDASAAAASAVVDRILARRGRAAGADT